MNKQRIKRYCLIILSLIYITAIFTGCSVFDSAVDYTGIEINMDTSENAIENLTMYTFSTMELSTQNPFRSVHNFDLYNVSRLYDGLISYDNDGNVIPAVATSWEHNDECTTWTFHIRDDCYWVNYKGEIQDRITSYDFATGLEWVLNYSKNEGSSLMLAIQYIDGGSDYFEYSQSLSTEEAQNISMSDFYNMVGIETPDENTVIYHTSNPCPYFLSVLTTAEFIPLSQKHIDDVGIEDFIINSYMTAWFNGPYIMTEFIPGNEKILDANPHWYGNDEHTRFKSVTYKIVENSNSAYQLYENGEVDFVELYQSQITSIFNDKDNETIDYLVATEPNGSIYQLIFNYQKLNEDGSEDLNWNKAVGNNAFRQSIYHGLNLYSLLEIQNLINPKVSEAETITSAGMVYFSDGTDYYDVLLSKLDLNSSNNEKALDRNNEDLAEKYKQQAIEELTDLGVSFPIMMDYYVSSSKQSDLDFALVIKAAISESLGDDYVQLNIKTYASSYTTEVLMPQLHSITRGGWVSDYADPSCILFQYVISNPDAYYDTYMNIGKYTEEEVNSDKSYMKEVYDLMREYENLYYSANDIYDDIDKRYEVFTDAEALLIKNGLSLPFYKVSGWTLTRVDTSQKPPSVFGCFSERLVDTKTNKNGYTNSIWEGDES